jgi:hypothetical protein
LARSKASVNTSRAKGDNEFPTAGRSMVMRQTPSSPVVTTIPGCSSVNSLTPALTAFPLFGYLHFHIVTSDAGHDEEARDV